MMHVAKRGGTEVRQSSGISYLLAAASHTHSASVVQDTYRDATPAWETAALLMKQREIFAACEAVGFNKYSSRTRLMLGTR
jgi:hypothetical protein